MLLKIFSHAGLNRNDLIEKSLVFYLAFFRQISKDLRNDFVLKRLVSLLYLVAFIFERLGQLHLHCLNLALRKLIRLL
jgi:hypothetical protein